MRNVKLGKARIRQTAWGNWYGYLGTRRVEMFCNSSTETQEQAAQRWLNDRDAQALSLLNSDFARSARVED